MDTVDNSENVIDPDAVDRASVVKLAAEHGLTLDPESLRRNDFGLDFLVVHATADDGVGWILRIPRSRRVMPLAAVEGRVLELLKSRVSFDFPDWRIHSDRLIAYPALPGTPGLEITADGTTEWFVDVNDPVFAASLGDVLAELHSVPPELAVDAGIPLFSPVEVRARWLDEIDVVAAEFTISAELLDSWDEWLNDASFWPEHSVLTHGEVYPGHTMVSDSAITGLIDWTTAEVGDPARDLSVQQSLASPESFEITLEHYHRGGGRTWPRFIEHCRRLNSTDALTFAQFALETGDVRHKQTAAEMLNP